MPMRSLLILFSSVVILLSCKPEIPDNCEGEYSFKREYYTSHPNGRIKPGDTVAISTSLPIEVYNFSSDSIVNINRFGKVLCGFTVEQYLPDSSNGIGIKSQNAKNDFNYLSQNVKLDFTEGIGGRSRVRFYLKKTDSAFIAIVQIIPKKKGYFTINLLSGVIEDAFCGAGVHAFFNEEVVHKSLNNYKTILSKLNAPLDQSLLIPTTTSYTLIVD